MTVETDRLRNALHRAEPRLLSRAKGMNAAMAAFETAFDETREDGHQENIKPSHLIAPHVKSKPAVRPVPPASSADEISYSDVTDIKIPDNGQGPDSHKRLMEQNAPRRGVTVRRRFMTDRFPTLNMMLSGSAVAAALAVLVALPDLRKPGSVAVDAVLSDDSAPASARSFEPEAGVVAAVDAKKAIRETEQALSRSVPLSGARQDAHPVLADTSSPPPSVLATPSLPAPAALVVQDYSLNSAVSRSKIQIAPADTLSSGYQAQGLDRFEQVEDSSILRTKDAPVSTFSVDVDTASYSFMRSSLNRGQVPEPDSIRVEELINYFPYQYDAPESADQPFKVSVTVSPTPWNRDTKLMHIGIKGYVPDAGTRRPANIVLLIDTSGSMNSANKLPLLINSFKLLLDTLDENDTVSVVTYAGSAGTVLEPTPASERGKIISAFRKLRAGGSTAGAAGLALAYEKAQENFEAEGINRVILATDGDFNVGFSSPAEMRTFVGKQRDNGIFLSVLGFGRGNYNDHLMQVLAQNGNGVAAYIDTLSEARKVLADEAGGILVPIAKDVKIQVEFNPSQVSEYRLIGYETRALAREDFNDDKVDAGEIGAGHTVTAIYELTPTGSPAELIDDLRYAGADAVADVPYDDATDGEYAFVKIRYKLPDQDTSTLITRPVDRMDETVSFGDAAADTRFAASVAAFGQMLRGNVRLNDYTYNELIAIAGASKGEDEFGYRAEFINLVRLAKSLDTNR